MVFVSIGDLGRKVWCGAGGVVFCTLYAYTGSNSCIGICNCKARTYSERDEKEKEKEKEKGIDKYE